MEVSEARRAPGSPEATVWRITGVWAVATLLGVCELFELGVSCAAVAGIGAAGIVAFAALRAAVRRARDRTGPEPLTAATVITTLRAAALTLLGVAFVGDTAAVAAITESASPSHRRSNDGGDVAHAGADAEGASHAGPRRGGHCPGGRLVCAGLACGEWSTVIGGVRGVGCGVRPTDLQGAGCGV